MCCSEIQCVAAAKNRVRAARQIAHTCYSVLQCVAVRCIVLHCVAVCCSVLQCVALCCIVLQCVAMSVSVLQ